METRGEDFDTSFQQYYQAKGMSLYHPARARATRVRACNYIKIKKGRNFPPILKIVMRTAQLCKMLMLLCVHVTRVLLLVLAGYSALTMGFYGSYMLLY